MKTIHKFVLKSYLGPMILTFFIVMFILLMQFMWRYIDELVGKGVGMGTILELMMYALATLIPMGLPLATLLAAIMTMGNLGENYELLAMRSAGLSMMKIIKPLTIVIAFVAVGSFFVSNNLVPYSTKKMFALLYDIRNQKQSIEFKDGIFFNGIDNISIRVGKQDPETKLLTNVLIYDTRDTKGNMTTTVADSGYIHMTDDKKFLMVTLYNGETYETTRAASTWFKESKLRRHFFAEQQAPIALEGFDFTRSNSDLFNSSQTKNIVELGAGIDSLSTVTQASTIRSYEPLLRGYIFVNEPILAQDTVPYDLSDKRPLLLTDSIAGMDIYKRKELLASAKSNAASSKSFFTYDEASAKEALNQLYRYKVDWHRKLSLPVSIMIFFLIGAPLGAIIRKGGLGMPIVVSVGFFVIYYIITITGEKMAREGTWSTLFGMWLPSLILLPIAVFLTYKATNDSNLFNADWYFMKMKQIKAHFNKSKNKKEE